MAKYSDELIKVYLKRIIRLYAYYMQQINVHSNVLNPDIIMQLVLIGGSGKVLLTIYFMDSIPYNIS